MSETDAERRDAPAPEEGAGVPTHGDGGPPPAVSVIVPTHNRPTPLAATLGCLRNQTLAPMAYELIVVDDGSTPPVRVTPAPGGPRCSVIRLGGGERSRARNAGAAAARAGLLVFVDDDLLLPPGFLEAHLRAHRAWPDALLGGPIRLPAEALARPFGRFRQALEETGVPTAPGVTNRPTACAAGNMAVPRGRFLQLGGFDPAIVSGEDQDLALRYAAAGGSVAFVPDAGVVHCDHALDVRSYCRRAEWGAENLVPFCRRYPDLPANRERERVNGPVRWRTEPVAAWARKLAKAALAVRPARESLFGLCWLLERTTGEPPARLYRLLLGVHIQRGFRRGLRRSPARPGGPAGPPGRAAAHPAEPRQVG